MKTIIQTPTPDIEKSLNFYSSLDFKLLSEENPTLVSDGKCIIEINPDRFARAGVKLTKPNWEQEVKELRAITTVQKMEWGYLLSDPSGTWIYLIELEEFGIDISSIDTSIFGNNAGLSLETMDINLSYELWKIIGFTNQQGSLDQGWVTLSNNDAITVSLMKPNTCPHLFFNPSLTFFNGVKNVEIIDKIKQLDISITEEITHFNKEGEVDNIIIRDPGGLGFFLFND